MALLNPHGNRNDISTCQSGYTAGGDLEKNHAQVTYILQMLSVLHCCFSLSTGTMHSCKVLRIRSGLAGVARYYEFMV